MKWIKTINNKLINVSAIDVIEPHYRDWGEIHQGYVIEAYVKNIGWEELITNIYEEKEMLELMKNLTTFLNLKEEDLSDLVFRF